jgi:hypothetical protein
MTTTEPTASEPRHPTGSSAGATVVTPPSDAATDATAAASLGATARSRLPWARRQPPSGLEARLGVGLLLTAGYLLCSLGIWWAVWSGHPTSTYLCGCGDPGQYLWFFAAPADALRHGHLPFFTGADYHPGGVNLLDNPGVLGLAIVAAPLTWAFGPVFAVNVVLLVTPVLSALAGYVLLRRFVAWWPAAAVAAGFFGFSPFAVSELEYVHLQAAFLALTPLILLCLHELLVRQRRRPVPVGVALGVLLVAQYLVSPEMLVLVTLVAAVGIVLLVVGAAASHPEELRRRLPTVGRGLAAGAVTALVLAGYPLWFALDGPRHTVGAPWTFIAQTGNNIVQFFVPGSAAGRQALAPGLFGYFGDPGPAGNYLGPTVVVALLATVVVLRRSPLVRLVAATGLVVAVLSLGTVLVTASSSLAVHTGQRPDIRWWLPWTFLAHVPLVNEASPSRLSGLLDLLVALLGAVGLDHVHTALERRTAARRPLSAAPAVPAVGGAPAVGTTPVGPSARTGIRRWSLLPAGVSLAIAAAALVPVGTTYRLPLVTTTVRAPAWFETAASHLPPDAVVLALPWGLSETSVWQAVTGMHITMAGGDAFVPGADGHVNDQPPKGSTDAILTDLSTFAIKPEPTPAVEQRVRRSFARWGVTDVVVTPDVVDTSYDVGLLAAILGSVPTVQAGAWVFTDVGHAPAPWPEPADALAICPWAGVPPLVTARCLADLAQASRATSHRHAAAQTRAGTTTSAPDGPAPTTAAASVAGRGTP